MEKNEVIEALHALKANSPKRNFKQSYDLIVNLKDLDLKKVENQIDLFTQLHFGAGKPVKIGALVGPEMKDTAREVFPTVIDVEQFDLYQREKKTAKKLAADHDFFIAQAAIMPKVAGAFGKVLGPRGKMPNPKAGCVVPPNANLKALAEKLSKTIRISIKTAPTFMCRIGTEEMPEEQVVDNILVIYNAIKNALPHHDQNIRHVMLKFTMGHPVKIGAIKAAVKSE